MRSRAVDRFWGIFYLFYLAFCLAFYGLRALDWKYAGRMLRMSLKIWKMVMVPIFLCTNISTFLTPLVIYCKKPGAMLLVSCKISLILAINLCTILHYAKHTHRAVNPRRQPHTILQPAFLLIFSCLSHRLVKSTQWMTDWAWWRVWVACERVW